MSIAALITDLIAAGTPSELVGRVAAALAERDVVTVKVKDEAAERRRAADRERKANVRRIPQTSADSADKPLTPLVPPALPPTPPNPPPYNPPEPSISVHRKRSTPSEFFDRFWQAYPRREGANPKQPALKAFNRAVDAGAEPETIILGAQHYRVEQNGKDARFVAQAVTWLNQERWADYAKPALSVVPSATSPPSLARKRLSPQEVEEQVRAFGIIK